MIDFAPALTREEAPPLVVPDKAEEVARAPGHAVLQALAQARSGQAAPPAGRSAAPGPDPGQRRDPGMDPAGGLRSVGHAAAIRRAALEQVLAPAGAPEEPVFAVLFDRWQDVPAAETQEAARRIAGRVMRAPAGERQELHRALAPLLRLRLRRRDCALALLLAMRLGGAFAPPAAAAPPAPQED
ncbi:hypothetical protein [Mangrovicoccus algicola]|uniref:Uncharacterized protein n=1 Tax=Mangrovicoccus algicola TaxID=2771008 RepID=A0A8J6ZHH8_9RHOB|nr:hypothetical protein [Mangrovicoccus algicola]MBE3640700.1 hypothetical protein [Mangrovicoccus algicola]